MDEIRRKLELIDRQLARRNFHERIISTCPLVFVAVGLIAGILIQSHLDLPVLLWSVPMALLAMATVVFFCIQRFGSAGRYVMAYLALVCFACLGAIRLTHYGQPEPNDIRKLVGGERRLATIRGSIVTEPYISRYPDWKFARFTPTDPTSSFYLSVTAIEMTRGWEKVAGTVRVQVGEPVLDLKIGDAIQAYCWLDRFGPATNPGQFDTAGYLARRNVFVAVSIQSRAGIRLLASPSAGALTRLRARMRQVAANALLGDMPQDKAGRGLLQALLLGYRREIDSDTYRAFRRTGLLHLISLSGMHLGILVGIIWMASKTAGFLKPARAAICAIAIGIFLLIVPPRAPTVRAAIICWVFCASILLRRHSSPINTLSLAAVFLLLIRPTQLFEAGWQLSFASVLGIVLLTQRIEALMHEHVVDRFRSERTPKTGAFRRVAVKFCLLVTRLLAVGLAAWLGSAGILLYHFCTITPLASIWTVLAFPLVSAILVLGFLKMILFFLLPTLSAVLGAVVILLSGVLIRVVRLIAHLDISQILVGQVTLVPIILYYAIVAFVGFVYLRRPLLKRAISIAMVLTLSIYLGAVKWQRTYRDDLVLTCLDVGHGQAILVRLPGKANVLFDAGSLHRRDVGARLVVPYLEHAGMEKIDAIIISHNDVDHINGIPEVVEHGKVGHIYANDAFFDRTDVWGTAQFLRECLAERGLEIERLRGDLDLTGSAKIRMLWPDEQAGGDEALSDNDRSLVSLIEFAGTEILLCSDIEQFAQRELLRRYPGLRAEAVVVPHHGSTRTLVPEFLEALNASVLICSCDRSQYERASDTSIPVTGPPGRAKLFHTPKHGTVTVRVSKDGTLRTDVFAE